MCTPIKLNLPFCERKPLFDALSNVYQTDVGLSDVFVVTVIARNNINGVGSLFFRDRILKFSENMPQSLKRFLRNFNVVAIQNSLDGFCNTLNVRNNSKTSRWLPFIKSVTSCNWSLAVTEEGFCLAICHSMKVLDRSVETFGLWMVTSSVRFIKSLNQSSIKLCLPGLSWLRQERMILFWLKGIYPLAIFVCWDERGMHKTVMSLFSYNHLMIRQLNKF